MRTDDQPTTGQRFQESQSVVLDLREPPTREEAGIAEGRNSLVVDRRPGGDPLRTSFTLPDGKVLEVPAVGVILAAAPAAGPGAPVETLTVNRAAEDLAAAHEAVRADAATLGIDAAEVDAFFGAVRPGTRVQKVFTGQRIGYLRAEVEVSHDPANGPFAELGYKLNWGSMFR